MAHTLSIKSVIAIAACCSLVACGGGGGSSKPEPQGSSQPPVTVSSAAASSSPTASSADASSTATIVSSSTAVMSSSATSSTAVSSSSVISSNSTQSSVLVVASTTPSSVAQSSTPSSVPSSSQPASSVASSMPADTTPDAFSFTAVTDAAVNTVVTSGTATIASINQATAISVTGGEYAIDSGAFTTAAGTVTVGQTVKVRLTTSANTNTATSATLTVGGVSATFSVTTLVSTQPTAFSFTPVVDVALSSVNTSGSINVAGIDVAVPISITGGEYAIDNGTFTSTAGTVNKNQSVKVRGTASAATSTTTNVVLTIGGTGNTRSGTYVITTLTDTAAPTASVLFPPPASQTEGNTILVRGTASDDYNTITSIKVNGVDATTTDGFATWQAEITLGYATLPVVGTTNNTVTISTADNKGNTNANAASFAIRQAPASTPFPDANNLFTVGRNLALDNFGGRNRLLVNDQLSNSAGIYSVDLATGTRSLYASNSATNGSSQSVSQGYFGYIDPSNQHYYAFGGAGELMEYDLTDPTSAVRTYYPNTNEIHYSRGATVNTNTGNFIWLTDGNHNPSIVERDKHNSLIKIVSDSTHPDSTNPLYQYDVGIVFDAKRNRYLVPHYLTQSLIAIDATTGARTIVSNSSVGTGDNFAPADPTENFPIGTGGILSIAINSQEDLTYVSEFAGNSGPIVPGKIFSIDLANGNRKAISTDATDTFNQFHALYALVLTANNAYLYANGYDIADNIKIYAIDIKTGKRVIVSN